MRFSKRFVAPMVLLAAAMAASVHGQQVVFVEHNAPPNGDGTSWRTAFNTLQDALAHGRTLGGPVQFWIAAGVYRPDDGAGLTPLDRTLSFELFDGAVLLGGFNGTEQFEKQRNPAANKTMLTGDLMENGPNDDDSHHLVTTCGDCSGLAVLDGLIIRDTNADGATPEGGGLRIVGDLEVHVINCEMKSNFAGKGAGVAVIDGKALLDGCTILNNKAFVDAPGLLARGSSVVTITNSQFINNENPEIDHVIVNEPGSTILVTNSVLESFSNIGVLNSGGVNSGDELLIGGDYEQSNDDAAGLIQFDLGGTEPGVTHDQIQISGDASLRGVANLLLISDFVPEGSEVFKLLVAGSISEEFDVAVFPNVGNDRTFVLNYIGGGALAGDVRELDASLEETDKQLDFDEPVKSVITAEPADIAMGDLNGDLFAEAVFALPAENKVDIAINGGNVDGQWQGFESVVDFGVGNNPVAVAIGDLNGDFVNDIVVANHDDNTVSVLINNSNLTHPSNAFTRTDFLTGGTGPVDVAIADILSTGSPDIIIANEGGNVTILTQSALAGGGGFILGAVLDDPVSPGSVDPADLDNDKDLDLVIGDSGAGMILAAGNNGAGSFAVTNQFFVRGGVEHAQAQDVNGDGLIDVVALAPGSDSMSLVLNEGLGFSPLMSVPVGSDPNSMAFADVDDDGDTDIAVVVLDGSGNRVVQVVRNDSGGGRLAYSQSETLGVEDGPLVVATSDVDNDGTADVVAGSSPSSELAGAASSSPREGGGQGGGGGNGGGNGGGPPGQQGTGLVSAHVSEPIAANPLAGEACPTDLDGSGSVDINDLLAVLAAWGSCAAPCPEDVTADGEVGIDDLLEVLAAWGSCP